MSNATGYVYCFIGILKRELYRFVHQYSRLIAALVRPLVWLFIFAAGVRAVFDIGNIAPYDTSVVYEVYMLPGLAGMILLFSAMQSSLSIVYDREMGSMRALLISPFPRWYLLTSKLLAGVFVSMIQVYIFLGIATFWGLHFPAMGYLYAMPAILVSGMMLAALGLLLSSVVKQLENFAGVMNFIIFPLLFASSALYPLSQIEQSSLTLYKVAQYNPFTHVVELIRFAFYGQVNIEAFVVVTTLMVVLLCISNWLYRPSRRFNHRGSMSAAS